MFLNLFVFPSINSPCFIRTKLIRRTNPINKYNKAIIRTNLSLCSGNNTHWKLSLLSLLPTEVFYKKAVLENFAIFTRKHLRGSIFLIKLQKKETSTQMFSCQYCKILKNIYSDEQLRMAASECWNFFFVKSCFHHWCSLEVKICRKSLGTWEIWKTIKLWFLEIQTA